jgi:hypothetical protein
MKTSLILAKINYIHGLIDPDWVDGGPGQPGPLINEAIVDYMVAGVLRDIGKSVSHKEVKQQVLRLSKGMVERSSAGLVAGWELGDDICPPWPWPRPKPFPWPFPWPWPGPDPDPWWDTMKGAMNDVVLAQGLRSLARLTSDKSFSADIAGLSETLVQESLSQVYDDFCGTPVKPRIPKKRPGRK